MKHRVYLVSEGEYEYEGQNHVRAFVDDLDAATNYFVERYGQWPAAGGASEVRFNKRGSRLIRLSATGGGVWASLEEIRCSP